MLSRVFRFNELQSNDSTFIGAAMPGHNRTSMGALGRGKAEEDLMQK
jgi:hypothetical protein